MVWKALSFVLSSEQREKVIKSLKHPSTPTKISKETNISKAHTSRILKSFEKMGLVECKTPEKRKGKIYTLTEKGNNILKKLEKE